LAAKDNISPIQRAALHPEGGPVDFAKRNSCARPRAHEKTKVVARKGRRIGRFSPDPREVRYFLAASQTSASASPENNRQPEEDDCDRHERRAGDVSDQDEDDRDDGEDCSDVVVHSFYVLGLRHYGVSQRRADCAVGLTSRRVRRLESVSREQVAAPKPTGLSAKFARGTVVRGPCEHVVCAVSQKYLPVVTGPASAFQSTDCHQSHVSVFA
jgi:hypothetical protein